jgi:hypothetical protein
MVHNSTLQIVLRSLNEAIADERGRGDPNGLVKGLIEARARVRAYVPQQLRELDLQPTL